MVLFFSWIGAHHDKKVGLGQWIGIIIIIIYQYIPSMAEVETQHFSIHQSIN